MKGKKIDVGFISSFIKESVSAGANTPELIVNRAQAIVDQIDLDIRLIESKKILRSKLLDVIAKFDFKDKTSTDTIDTLPYFKLQYPDACRALCNIIKNGPLDLDKKSLSNLNDKFVTEFVLKQLLESKILDRVENIVMRGEKFNDYLRVVFHE